MRKSLYNMQKRFCHRVIEYDAQVIIYPCHNGFACEVAVEDVD